MAKPRGAKLPIPRMGPLLNWEAHTLRGRFDVGSHGARSSRSNVESFALAGTVMSDALGTPFATFAPGGAAAAVAWTGLFAEAADLVEKGMAI